MFKAFKWRTSRQREEPAVPEVPAPDAVFIPEVPGNITNLEEGSFYWYGPPPVYDVGYGQGIQPFYQAFPQNYGQPYAHPNVQTYPQPYGHPYAQPMGAPAIPMPIPMPLPVVEEALPAPSPAPPAATPSQAAAASPALPKPKISSLRILVNWLLVVIGFFVVTCAGIVYYYSLILPDPRGAALANVPPNMRIVAADGTFIAERGMRREYVPHDRLPRTLVNAVIATEDRRFQYHFGFDPIGTARALLRNRRAGEIVQGGSTVTQQLAKNLFLDPGRTWRRKAQEVFVAMWLESKFTKNDIMELYLNRVYFGSGNYGIGAAAYHYFNKRAEQLTLAEAALLVGLIKAPSSLSPRANRPETGERTSVVLKNMLNSGFITEADYKDANAHPAAVQRVDPAPPGFEHVIDWIAEMVPSMTGEVNTNLTVETSLDVDLQRHTDAVVKRLMARDGRKLRAGQAAVAVLSPDGGVKAMFGGMDYEHSQFNRAVKAQRQPGSVFKPFVYLAALEGGLTPDSLVEDTPVEVAGWTPENYNATYRGTIPLKTALAQSSNAVAVRLLKFVGEERAMSVAHRLGITAKLDVGPSLALGSAEMTLMELTGAYASFANQGTGVLPYVIVRIRDDKGHVVYERKSNDDRRVIATREAGQMNEMLNAVVTTGTGHGAVLPGRPVAGKTGTSSGYRDAWFIGYTADFVGGVWVGNDRQVQMKFVTGGGLPAAIWREIMDKAHNGLPVRPLPGTHLNEPPPPPDQIEQAATAITETGQGRGGAGAMEDREPGAAGRRGARAHQEREAGAAWGTGGGEEREHDAGERGVLPYQERGPEPSGDAAGAVEHGEQGRGRRAVRPFHDGGAASAVEDREPGRGRRAARTVSERDSAASLGGTAISEEGGPETDAVPPARPKRKSAPSTQREQPEGRQDGRSWDDEYRWRR